jgi:hypothetical protein
MGSSTLPAANALALASGVLLVLASDPAAAQVPIDDAWPYERGALAIDAGVFAATTALRL